MSGFWKRCKQSGVLTMALCIVLVIHTAVAPSSSLSPSSSPLLLQTGGTLAVIGVTQEESRLRSMDSKSSEYRRIGFGLTTLLAEVLFDTGKFRLFEEKEVHKRELLENLVSTYWIEPGARFSVQMLHSVATQLGVGLLAYGSIAHTSTSQRHLCFGPFCHHKQQLHVRVNVCLYEASADVMVCRAGQGAAQQEAAGVIYEFRGDRLDFHHNAAGRATKHAVMVAVQELVAGIRFLP